MHSRKNTTIDFQPIIIIGAARSGTNMLRDLITKIPNCGTWDCDEINPIWYHGNRDQESDVFTEEMATPKVQAFIKKEFQKISKATKSTNVIEKSCANSLKVPFINKIFPNAKFIFIHRDGRDSTASGLLEWTKRPSLIYTLKKVRYVPLSDLPYYLSKFGKNHLSKIFNAEQRLSFYGVNIPNIQELLKKHTLSEISALQWKDSVEYAMKDLNEINKKRVLSIKYEEFVTNPISEFQNIINFLDINSNQLDLAELLNNVSKKSIGKYKKLFDENQRKKIEALIGDTLQKLNYSLEF